LTDDYLGDILAALSASPFVHEPKFEIDDREEVWFIRADVHFIDNSLLHFRESSHLTVWANEHESVLLLPPPGTQVPGSRWEAA